MTPEALVRAVEGFLSGARDAVVLEDGAVVFDLAQANQVCDLMTEVETTIHSRAEMSFHRYGLEFARARLIQEPGSIRSTPQIVFGVGAAEQTLSPETAASFARLVRSIGEVRHAEGPRDHPLWRLHSERWLESLTQKRLRALDERFDEEHFYSQVPGFSASDRAIVDVLTATGEQIGSH